MDHFFLIAGAGLLAGAMNALAGGGSFVTIPALIAAGVPSVQANASSTVALFPGGLASAWVYRDGLQPLGNVSMRLLLLITLIGGILGAVLLLMTSAQTFDHLLPWLLLIATIVLSFGRQFGEWLRRHVHIKPAAVLIAQFILGIYGGYFGGAVGIMMMAVWSVLTNRDLKTLNPPRTIMVSTANGIAALTFIIAHAVYWQQTMIMLVAAIIGGYGGARIARFASPQAVRVATLILTFGITAAFFVRAYG